MRNYLLKKWLPLLLILIQACTNKEKATGVIIDSSDARKPVIKLPVTTKQKTKGQKAGWESLTSLFVVENGKPATTPVACRYTFNNDTLYCTPHLQLGNGLEFEVQVYRSGDTLIKRFTVPANPNTGPLPQVIAVYPDADMISANILMFHAVFNTPMSENPLAFRQVKLFDENGAEKQMVWREKSNWADSGRHLVLMIHPGRVKRGIGYFEGEGELFKPGKKYTLVITTEITDQDGRSLVKEYTKTFTATQPDRVMPEFKQNKFTAPAPGTLSPLELTFSEGMDYGSMAIGIKVTDSAGKKVNGTVIPITGEKWRFLPKEPWQKSTYTVELNDFITDITGNHLVRRFEEKDIQNMNNRQPVIFTFTIK